MASQCGPSWKLPTDKPAFTFLAARRDKKLDVNNSLLSSEPGDACFGRLFPENVLSCIGTRAILIIIRGTGLNRKRWSDIIVISGSHR
jgi:hypothetical protein